MYIGINVRAPEYGLLVIARTGYGITIARRINRPPFFVDYLERPVIDILEWKYLDDNK